ncbi:MAG: hypothetical protein LAT81_02400 [Oceanicaulis sp.]|nr:hypothetical protein [Oceanicaulis sp.]
MARTPLGALTLGLLACLAAGDCARAQTQDHAFQGEIRGTFGSLDYEGRIPAPDARRSTIPRGANYAAMADGDNTAVMVHFVSIGSDEEIRRGPEGYYGDMAVRLDLEFGMERGAGEASLNAGMLQFASVSFVEVWASDVITPSLFYATEETMPSVTLEVVDWTDEGIRVSGAVSGEACLYFDDTSQHGGVVRSRAIIMGEPLCPRFDLQFSALASAWPR